VSSPKEVWWDPTIYYSKQSKRKQKTKIKTLQEEHIAYDLIFLFMKKGVPWASPSFDACAS
jgi:hypothetical protein